MSEAGNPPNPPEAANDGAPEIEIIEGVEAEAAAEDAPLPDAAAAAAALAEIDKRLGDPKLYQGPAAKIEALQIKRGEVMAAQERAEALWLAAEEALEAARGG